MHAKTLEGHIYYYARMSHTGGDKIGMVYLILSCEKGIGGEAQLHVMHLEGLLSGVDYTLPVLIEYQKDGSIKIREGVMLSKNVM